MMIGFPINKYQIIKKSINVYALPYSALASTPRFFFAQFNCVYYLIARNDDDHQFLNIQPPHVTLTCRMIDS